MPHQQLEKELLELTKELIAIPSTHSRPQEITNCAVFIEKWLSQHGINYERQFSQNIPTILVLPEKGAVPVLLMSHFDVVEADDDILFQPAVTDDRLYGRGSIDDKYGVALSLILYREHLLRLKQKGCSAAEMPIGLLFTGDEEIGGANGAAVAANRLTTEFFLAIDGGRPNLIVNKEKGIIQLELVAHGTAAHAARPWLGRSAFDILTKDYQKMRELFTFSSDDHWHKTMVLTQCHAGNGSSNIVPELARAVFDIRYTEDDNPEALIASIRSTVESDVTVLALEPVFEGAPSPYLDLLVECSQGAQVGFEHGASDARYLSQLGIPGAIWGADGEMSQHQKNEHIVIPSFYSLYKCLDRFVTKIQYGQTTR
ncbi:MAG: M20/M25/M40 family metallo-hydrolase [Desulfopila sp.]|nr:M20/M25/M40 family metallo-hydrolase [Desulfopila sp.]